MKKEKKERSVFQCIGIYFEVALIGFLIALVLPLMVVALPFALIGIILMTGMDKDNL